jgi:hypothetical protein
VWTVDVFLPAVGLVLLAVTAFVLAVEVVDVCWLPPLDILIFCLPPLISVDAALDICWCHPYWYTGAALVGLLYSP